MEKGGGVMDKWWTLAQKMLAVSGSNGAVVKYIHDIEGHIITMEEIQGAVLNVKLNYLDQWTRKGEKEGFASK